MPAINSTSASAGLPPRCVHYYRSSEKARRARGRWTDAYSTATRRTSSYPLPSVELWMPHLWFVNEHFFSYNASGSALPSAQWANERRIRVSRVSHHTDDSWIPVWRCPENSQSWKTTTQLDLVLRHFSRGWNIATVTWWAYGSSAWMKLHAVQHDVGRCILLA